MRSRRSSKTTKPPLSITLHTPPLHMPILNPCSRIPVKTLQALSTQPHTLPTRQTRNLDHWRHYAGVLPNAPLRGASVAILGGGITGLVSAYYLSRLRSDLQITLFESSDRLGGWLHSTSVDVGTGKVVFEQGPRNLRPSQPNGTLTLDLVGCLFFYRSLDIIPSVHCSSKLCPFYLS